jgi:hypothetical protein
MSTAQVRPVLETGLFTWLFLGGGPNVKWHGGKAWVDLAREHQLMVHIGQAGRVEYLRAAHALGVDSVDSSSFARNDSWSIVDEFRNRPKQDELFVMPEKEVD